MKRSLLSRILSKFSQPFLKHWLVIRRRLDELYRMLITYWEGEVGDRLRYRYYKRRLGALGIGARIDVGVRFECEDRIFIGPRVHIDRFCYLVGASADLDLSHRDLQRLDLADPPEAGKITIAGDCHLSQGVMIFGYGGVEIGELVTLSAGSRMYSLSSLPYSPNRPGSWSAVQPYEGSSPTVIGPIRLGKNVWLGLDVIVFPGVFIEEDSFVRSRSIVTKSCGPNLVIAGDPAQKKRVRFSNLGERPFLVNRKSEDMKG